MSSLVITLILAVILMALVAAGLSIGLILTGKSRLRRGCGYIPGKKKNDETTCPLCGDKKVCEKEDDKPNNGNSSD